MARLGGNQGRLLVAISQGGTPEPVAYLTKWQATFHHDLLDASSMDDHNKVYLRDIGAGTGNFNGWYDDVSAQLYAAAVDGVGRRFYLYPSLTENTRYWFGSGLFDFSVQGGNGEIIAVNGAWAATEVASAGMGVGSGEWDGGGTWDDGSTWT